MAFLDLRRMVRNYLPLKYREEVMELFSYTLVSAFEGLISRMEDRRRAFDIERLTPLTRYSFEFVRRRILEVYDLDPDTPSIITRRISLYESVYGRIVNVHFGSHYARDTNYHFANIKDFFPAGILINIQYD